MERNYDGNITLIKEVSRPEASLKDNEYYALMVVDYTPGRDKKDFFDHTKGYIGLECTGGFKKIYISKKFNNRSSSSRGETFLVRVNNPSYCYDLKY